jgi:4-hydroxy 2-oxovalerate aldolase
MLEGRDLLVIGSGVSVSDYLDGINRFIDRVEPVVFCLNANEIVPKERVSAYVACHRTRLLLDIDKFRQLGKPLILPLSAVPNEIRERLQGVEVLDYGMSVQKGSFDAKDKGCVVPSSLAAAYALAIGIAGGARRILLAGFDGYVASDLRQVEMNAVFERFLALPQAPMLIAVTPTTYNVPKSSVFAPSL